MPEVIETTVYRMDELPPAAREELTSLLVSEERRRSADYRHGMHTGVEGREADYLMLDRIGRALSRVREAETTFSMS